MKQAIERFTCDRCGATCDNVEDYVNEPWSWLRTGSMITRHTRATEPEASHLCGSCTLKFGQFLREPEQERERHSGKGNQ